MDTVSGVMLHVAELAATTASGRRIVFFTSMSIFGHVSFCPSRKPGRATPGLGSCPQG